jgi:transposase-like protein
MEKDTTKTLDKVIRVDESEIRGHLDQLVRGTVEETLNALLDEEADELCIAMCFRTCHTPRSEWLRLCSRRSMRRRAARRRRTRPGMWYNPMERLLWEARRRTKVLGAFPDGHSALMMVAARLRHVSATRWGTRKYMNMELTKEMDKELFYSVA